MTFHRTNFRATNVHGPLQRKRPPISINSSILKNTNAKHVPKFFPPSKNSKFIKISQHSVRTSAMCVTRSFIIQQTITVIWAECTSWNRRNVRSKSINARCALKTFPYSVSARRPLTWFNSENAFYVLFCRIVPQTLDNSLQNVFLLTLQKSLSNEKCIAVTCITSSVSEKAQA